MPLPCCTPNEMGQVKTLSTNEWRRITGVSQKQYKQVTWHTTTVVIKQTLTLKEYMSTIQNIFHDCKTPDDGVAVELLDFATRVNIISAYSFVDIPDNPNELYYLVYASDLYDLILSHANREQIKSIKRTVKMSVR